MNYLAMIRAMTRSARRSNRANAKPHQVSISDKRCEECHGALLHKHGSSYICSKCGLEQMVDEKD